MLQVIKAPDPRLRIQTKPVRKITPALKQTLDEMVKLTQTFKEPEGVGLASTQIGLTESFFVAKNVSRKNEDGSGFRAFINPNIISAGKKTKKYFEGCLSVPNVWGEVERYLNVKVSYLDKSGQTKVENLTGVLAWIFQHEMDHLNGVLFSEKVLQQGGKFYKYMGKDKAGSDIYEEMTI